MLYFLTACYRRTPGFDDSITAYVLKKGRESMVAKLHDTCKAAVLVRANSPDISISGVRPCRAMFWNPICSL